MTSRRTLPAVVMFAGLLVASCGGSSDESTDDSSSGSVSEESAEEASGSNEETEENSGLDVDLDDLEETIGDFSTGEGTGIVTIDGVTYEFDGELCIAFEGDISIEGPGVTADGDPFWGEISIGETRRDELAQGGIDDATLDSFFGDKESATDVSVEVEIGRTELFGSGPDDQPDYTATIVLDNPLEGEITFEADATNVTGSGQIIDANNVALDFGETAPFEFSGGCN